jgi:hypothetical protein
MTDLRSAIDSFLASWRVVAVCVAAAVQRRDAGRKLLVYNIR